MSEIFKKSEDKKDEAVASCSTAFASNEKIEEPGPVYNILLPGSNFDEIIQEDPDLRLRYYYERRNGEIFKKSEDKKDEAVASCSTAFAPNEKIEEPEPVSNILLPGPNFDEVIQGVPNRNRRLRYYYERRNGLSHVPVMRPDGTLYQRCRSTEFAPSRPYKPRLDPFGCISDPEQEDNNFEFEEFVHVEKPYEPTKVTRGIKRVRCLPNLALQEEEMAAAGTTAAGEMAAARPMFAREELAVAGAMDARGKMTAAREMSEAGLTGAATGEMVTAGAMAEWAMGIAFPKLDDPMNNGNLCSSFDKYFKFRD